MGTIEENEGKKVLVWLVICYNQALAKIKKIIDIEKLDHTKTLVNTDDKLVLFGGIICQMLEKCFDINDMCYKRW